MAHPLTAYRNEHGLSLEALGAQIGATKSMVWKWEKGETVPRRHFANKLYELTEGKVTPNDFVLSEVA